MEGNVAENIVEVLIRIGDKLINRAKIASITDQILELRAQGLSQQEVAKQLGVERTFISRLEGIGEIRQGNRLAVIGFPVANKSELEAVLQEEGVDFSFLLTDVERLNFVEEQKGAETVNQIMSLIMQLRFYDVVVIIGSDLRIKIAQTLLDKEVVPIYLGESPIKADKRVDPELLREILRTCRAKEEGIGSGKGRMK